MASTPEAGVPFIQWEAEFQFSPPIGPQSEPRVRVLLGSTERALLCSFSKRAHHSFKFHAQATELAGCWYSRLLNSHGVLSFV